MRFVAFADTTNKVSLRQQTRVYHQKKNPVNTREWHETMDTRQMI
jgi:hypothetical protein